MSITSVSRIKVKIEIKYKGYLEAELIRHLAPLSVGTIIRALPLEGRVVRGESYVGVITNLSLGAEKQREEFKKGEIAFMVVNKMVSIFTADTKIKGFNPLGRILRNIELLDAVESGDVMSIELSL